ncbi:MAG: cytidine deaminase [Puniceicoccaceae bacterium]|nr:MAG: cytidine deaminase [Puniceicoccaceae bacterium]
MSDAEVELPGGVKSGALLAEAAEAAGQAYAPYSGLRVGAVVVTTSGGRYTGCNVENASYGLTLCAERNAVAAAVRAEGAGLRLAAAACARADGGAITPCGACRQVLAEFAEPGAVVVFPGTGGRARMVALRDLLPESFGRGDLRS